MVLDQREMHICKLASKRISEAFEAGSATADGAIMRALSGSFDEDIISRHVEEYSHFPALPLIDVFEALHKLSEQTYENKALTFGCLLDAQTPGDGADATFPQDYFQAKKYKALSDGFRTAYHVSADGRLLDFVALDRYDSQATGGSQYYPEWSRPIARSSRDGRCGVALSRQGDILIFDAGALRFTYRYGKWQYWNHKHLISLLHDRARAQRVEKTHLTRVVGSIYRAALDVSFRRSGGLFVILHSQKSLHSIVRSGDAVGDVGRNPQDAAFDAVVDKHHIQTLPRAVIVELASLDGAVVLDNTGKIRAYGAVLQPKKSGRLRATEGSRTKAAIGASYYGMAVKVSSDGAITVYHKGREFISI